MHTKTWHVELFIGENERTTTARAVLHTEDPRAHGGSRTRREGSARSRSPPRSVTRWQPRRALHSLANALLEAAAGDIAEIERRPVHLEFAGPIRSALWEGTR